MKTLVNFLNQNAKKIIRTFLFLFVALLLMHISKVFFLMHIQNTVNSPVAFWAPISLAIFNAIVSWMGFLYSFNKKAIEDAKSPFYYESAIGFFFVSLFLCFCYYFIGQLFIVVYSWTKVLYASVLLGYALHIIWIALYYVQHLFSKLFFKIKKTKIKP